VHSCDFTAGTFILSDRMQWTASKDEGQRTTPIPSHNARAACARVLCCSAFPRCYLLYFLQLFLFCNMPQNFIWALQYGAFKCARRRRGKIFATKWIWNFMWPHKSATKRSIYQATQIADCLAKLRLDFCHRKYLDCIWISIYLRVDWGTRIKQSWKVNDWRS